MYSDFIPLCESIYIYIYVYLSIYLSIYLYTSTYTCAHVLVACVRKYTHNSAVACAWIHASMHARKLIHPFICSSVRVGTFFAFTATSTNENTSLRVKAKPWNEKQLQHKQHAEAITQQHTCRKKCHMHV